MRVRRNDCAKLISCCMSLLATRNAVGLLMSTLGLTNTGELTADSLTVKFPNCTAPRSNSVCANHRLSRDCSFMGESTAFFLFFLLFYAGKPNEYSPITILNPCERFWLRPVKIKLAYLNHPLS